MKISLFNPNSNLFFCAKQKNELYCREEITPDILAKHEEQSVINRYNELMNSKFSNQLSEEEICLLAQPWSIPYADFYERLPDSNYHHISLQEPKNKIKAIKDIRKCFETRFFSDYEIKKFIDLKKKGEFKSTSQIMRYIRLMAPDNGLPSQPTDIEAKYFAKKCTPYDEILNYYASKGKNPKLKEIAERPNLAHFSVRQNQADNSEQIQFVDSYGDERRYFTFINGVLHCASKSTLSNSETTNYDKTTKGTTILTTETIPWNRRKLSYSKDIIEILNDENNQPNSIRRTFFDEDHIAYTQFYNLSDFPEDLNVLEAIKNGTIKPSSETTTKTVCEDGSIVVEQSYQTKNASLKRKYHERKNSWELSLVIKDNEGAILYKTERSFLKAGNNTTITTINGKEYIATADDKRQVITIKYGDKVYEAYALVDNSKSFEEEMFNKDESRLWKFCKTQLPADIIIAVKRLQKRLIPTKNILSSEYEGGLFGEIKTGTNIGALSHEIGHLLDRYNCDISEGPNISAKYISQDENLRKIYKEELDEYNKSHNRFVTKNTINYFSEFGGSKDELEENNTLSALIKLRKKANNACTGLAEIVAETMYIKTAPNAKNPIMTLRTHILMMNFPRTIAYIANKIDENCSNSL
ncbi:MAG: hypothetical protein IKU37_04535 [Candidatus Gastranaerophilales bacterium]|nr:hypothetical protein [Candidatus Gastranaerophilales bacterium]